MSTIYPDEQLQYAYENSKESSETLRTLEKRIAKINTKITQYSKEIYNRLTLIEQKIIHNESLQKENNELLKQILLKLNDDNQ